MSESESKSGTSHPTEPIEVAGLRQALAKLVLANATEIVNGAIAKAKQGHYSVTKLLFALAGIYPAPGGADSAADHSLADFFCKELGLPEPSAPRGGRNESKDESHPGPA